MTGIMTEGKGSELDCPLEFKAGYPSFQCQDCAFWRNGICDYEVTKAVEESVGQLETVYPELSKLQLRLLARFAEFLVKEQASKGGTTTATG